MIRNRFARHSATLALSMALRGAGSPEAQPIGALTPGRQPKPRPEPHAGGTPQVRGQTSAYVYCAEHYTGPRPYASHATDLTLASTLEMAQEFSAMLKLPLERFEGFAVVDRLTPTEKAELLGNIMRDNDRAARSVHYTDFDYWPRLRMAVWRGVLAVWRKDEDNPRRARHGYTPPRGHA